MANKVEFGISNLYVGTYSVGTTGTVTMGTGYHQAGAISFSPEEQSESNKFYADNVVYWSGYTGGTFEGDLEVAKFDDTFKTQFLGYIQNIQLHTQKAGCFHCVGFRFAARGGQLASVSCVVGVVFTYDTDSSHVGLLSHLRLV